MVSSEQPTGLTCGNVGKDTGMSAGPTTSEDGILLPGGAGGWPLVGREADLDLARAALATMRGVAILGEPGTGKTRLATELVAVTAAEDDLQWHVVIGSRGASSVPLGAWAHLLPDSWTPGVDDQTTWRRLVASLAPSGGAIHLFVDDAQWLDPVSAGLLHHLVTSGQAKAVLTQRRPDAASQPLVALWKDGFLQRHDLEGFGAEQTEAVLEAALRAPVEPLTSRRMHERSAGNLLMLRELTEAALADGSLRQRHGAWVQHDVPGPSPRLVDLLADRVADLSPEDLAAAELVAVAEPIDLPMLVAAVGDRVVRRLVGLRLVEVDRVGTYRVVRSSHPLLAEVLVDRMGPLRRDEVIRQLVALYEAAASISDADLVRVAMWRLEIGLPIDGATALHASDLALARIDYPLAARLAEVALEGGQGAPAAVRLGEALYGQRRSADAEAVLAGVAGALDSVEPQLRLRYAEARALALGTDLGRLDDAIDMLEATLATMPDGRPRAALEARLAFVLSDCGRLQAAAPLAEARMAERDTDEVAALLALTAYTLVRSLSGRTRDALETCDEMLPVALRHLDEVPIALGWIAAQRMLALYLLGDLPAVDEFSSFVEAMVEDEADTTMRAAILMTRGNLAADRGQLDDALRMLRQSAALHDLDNGRGYQSWTMAITARVHAQRGDVVAAERALEIARDKLWPGGQVFDNDLDCAAMWIAMLRGRPTQAAAILEEVLERVEAEGMVVTAGSLRHEAIRLGMDPVPHIEPLARVVAVDQGRRSSIWYAHAVALAAGDGAGLVDAGQRFATLGTRLMAAEAFTRAADAHRRAGSPALATQAKERAREERALCPGADTPALRLDEAVVGLTVRELDVAGRAAAGMTNQGIADELGISVRTVETHLQRAFAKLGVNRRADLDAALRGR